MNVPVSVTGNVAFVDRMLTGIGSGLIGITGPAGSGKSTLSAMLLNDGRRGVYPADSRFIGSSLERRALLAHKQASSSDDYRDGANQFNWWDWQAIERDLTSLMAGRGVVIESAYERDSGKRSSDLAIAPKSQILYEGALLGPPQIVNKLKAVIFLCAAAPLRFERIVRKDKERRSFNEIVARFLITEFSEATYYHRLFAWAREKLIFIDSLSGQPCAPFVPASDLFIPLRMTMDHNQ